MFLALDWEIRGETNVTIYQEKSTGGVSRCARLGSPKKNTIPRNWQKYRSLGQNQKACQTLTRITIEDCARFRNKEEGVSV